METQQNPGPSGVVGGGGLAGGEPGSSGGRAGHWSAQVHLIRVRVRVRVRVRARARIRRGLGLWLAKGSDWSPQVQHPVQSHP